MARWNTDHFISLAVWVVVVVATGATVLLLSLDMLARSAEKRDREQFAALMQTRASATRATTRETPDDVYEQFRSALESDDRDVALALIVSDRQEALRAHGGALSALAARLPPLSDTEPTEYVSTHRARIPYTISDIPPESLAAASLSRAHRGVRRGSVTFVEVEEGIWLVESF